MLKDAREEADENANEEGGKADDKESTSELEGSDIEENLKRQLSK